MNAEVGYRIIRGIPDELIYGLALGCQADGTLELLMECNGSSDRSSEVAQLLCQLGARHHMGEHFSVLGALGTGVAGDEAERPQLHVYFGLQSRW